MRSTIVTASIAALASSVAASPASTDGPGNERITQVRVYGAPNCGQPTLGELGVFNNQNGSCIAFNENETVKSLTLVDQAPHCQLRIFSDLKCSFDEHYVPTGGCLSGDKQYRSIKVVCP
ncbi:hypothetical protein ACHAPJ_013011 [Fusarium lateritium]